MEESQLRVSSGTAAEDDDVQFWPAGTLAKGQFSCTCLWESRNRSPSTTALHGMR